MKNNEPHHFIKWCVHIQIVWRGGAIYLIKGTKRLVKSSLEKKYKLKKSIIYCFLWQS